MLGKPQTKPRRPRVPQRYYRAADILARVFRWHHIDVGRGLSWRLTFRVKALAKLAGIPADGDARDTYLDALATLQARGELDSPEVQKHTDALTEAAERAEAWHTQRRERDEEHTRQLATTQAPATAADFNDPWDELREEFGQFLDEIEPEEEAVEE